MTVNQETAPDNRSETDPLSLERQVCFALVVASRSVLSIYRPLLEPMGLTHPQYLVMLALWGEAPLPVGKDRGNAPARFPHPLSLVEATRSRRSHHQDPEH